MKLKKIILFFIFSGMLFFSSPIYAFQLKEQNFEDSIVVNFQDAVKDIRFKISPFLNSFQRKKLNSVKVFLDTSNHGLLVNSNSENDTITFSIGFIKAIMRYQLAETISSGYNYEVDLFGSESIDFHKQRFYEFYTNYLSYISDSINIKTESEMNENDVRWIKLIENTTDYRWQFKRRFTLIFLHEFYHQVQGYTQITLKLSSNKSLSESNKAKFLFNLECDCDSFVYSFTPKLKILPTNYLEVIEMFSHFKETFFYIELDILKRKERYLQLVSPNCKAKYLPFGVDCKSLRDNISYLKKNLKENLLTYQQMLSIYSNQNKSNSLDSLRTFFLLGYGYLTGGTIFPKDLDSAKFFFMKASDIGYKTEFIRISKPNSDDVSKMILYEIASLIAGKILQTQNTKFDIRYFERANGIAIYLPREEFYNRLLEKYR